MLETLLNPAYIIGRSHTVPFLAHALAFAINRNPNKPFIHFKIVPGADRSIRLFGQSAFDDSIPLAKPLDPEALATHLLRYSQAREPSERARYPEDSLGSRSVEGWTIGRYSNLVDEEGYPLVGAYATWIEL